LFPFFILPCCLGLSMPASVSCPAGWTASQTDQNVRIGKPRSAAAWPPSPLVLGLIIVPAIKMMYRKYFDKFSHWMLGSQPAIGAPPRRQFVWQINEGGPFAIRIGANIEPAPVQNNNDAGNAAQNDNQQQDQPQDDAAAAEQTVAHSTSSLGRLIGGALLVPAISNFMGSMLRRLSGRSLLLRRFLAVRPPLQGSLPPQPLDYYSFDQNWHGLGALKQTSIAMKLALSIIWGGTQTWAECDPVWWRNSIGLGLFIVAKDCMYLLHTWLTKRELQSRRVKDRSFEGIDIRELDLIHPPSMYRS